jgi:hypothetical protein
MAINLMQLYDNYNGDVSYLSNVKGNCPFEYYTDDPEFLRDAKSAAKYVAQRLGTGIGLSTLNISDLTIYAAFEEAVTTYGNLVYQYKIRDNYINMEGSETSPFSNIGYTHILSDDIGSPVTWSAPRPANWAEVNYNQSYSASIVDNEIWVISASINDFIAPDFSYINSFTLGSGFTDPTYTGPGSLVMDLSQFVYNQFNRTGGATIVTPYYNAATSSFNAASISITSGSTSFVVTGSNNTITNFYIGSGSLPDTDTSFYIVTGSTAAETAANIAAKLTAVSSASFGTSMTFVTGSPATTLNISSSLSYSNPTNFRINGTGAQFTGVTSGSNYSIPEGYSHIYFFTTTPNISGTGARFTGSNGTIPTVYIQTTVDTFNDKVLSNNLTTITSVIADGYGAEANVGGNYDVKKGTLKLIPGEQDYDLNEWAAVSESLELGDTIEVRRVYHEQPPAIARYFDPYAGTGTGVQSLLETFGFGQFSPGINFLLMPMNFDLQKIQSIELNDTIRRAGYSFELQNNKLRIFPRPSIDLNLFFEYVKKSNKNSILRDRRKNVVTDIMNVPYRNPVYMNINTVGRMWIFKYTLALAREVEAHIRIQYSSTSIQGIGPINGSELITDARKEKEDLILELKEMLNEVSRKSQLERKQQEAGFLKDTLASIPLPIYIK